MRNIEKKQDQIIEIIRTINDPDLLDSLERMLNFNSKAYRLSEKQLAMVEESKAQIGEGNYKSHEEVIGNLRKWLKEK